mgnify:CR=1 FL=1
MIINIQKLYFLIILLITTTVANAEFTVCNKMGDMAYVALAHNTEDEGDNYQIQGWFNISPDDCSVLASPMKHRIYYLRAITNSLVLEGDYHFCVNNDDAFEYIMSEKDSESFIQCKKLGLISSSVEGFVVVDTEEYEKFTYTLMK